MLKRIAAFLLIVVTAAALCACNEKKPEDKTADYPGTYVYSNSTLREKSSRTLTLNVDGTYSYTRESTLYINQNGTFTGRWEADEEGVVTFTADGSGKISRGKLSEDSERFDIADIDNAEDTVGSGIYTYQYPDEE